MISKELLNQNRVLTLRYVEKASYLIVNLQENKATMMAISNYGGGKDILAIKTFENKGILELVDEAIWLCDEFSIKVVLVDKFQLCFYKEFVNCVPYDHIDIRQVNLYTATKNGNIVTIKNKIEENLNHGELKFLQSLACAEKYYKTRDNFLGYSQVMGYHKETDELINELDNLKYAQCTRGIKLIKENNEIDTIRVSCLFIYYIYSIPSLNTQNINE